MRFAQLDTVELLAKNGDSDQAAAFFWQCALSWLPFVFLEQWRDTHYVQHRSEQSHSLGNAGQNAEVKSTSGGKSVANFSLAINQPSCNKKGGNQRVEWVRCVACDKLAQIAEKFVAKGTVVFVERRLQTRQFDDREGATKTVTELVVTSLRLVGGAKA
ncbi:MAG: single-stranded DNA-binding protein [Candidatus Acidiferrales bacterium]